LRVRLNPHLIALIGLAFAACATPPRREVACAPPPGAEALWRNPETRYLVLGEMHGTVEMPAVAAELTCHAAADGAQTLLALELPVSNEPALRQFIAGEIDAAAMTNGNVFWERGRDGRNSVAMVALLERVRALKAAGLSIDIVAFFPWFQLSDEEAGQLLARFPVPEGVDAQRSLHDIRMAARIIDESERRGAERTVVLIGNAHAVVEPSPSSSLNPTTGETRSFVRMHTAAAMPRAQTLSLNLTYSGGTAFSMTRGGAGVSNVPGGESELTVPGVVIAPTPANGSRYDGRIFIGAITASPPFLSAAE
jgi:hypothetical protein